VIGLGDGRVRARPSPARGSLGRRMASRTGTAGGALERGTAFLLANQGGDGLWRDFLTPAGEASEWPTGYVAAALHLAGAEAGALEKAVAALAARQNDDGGWGYHEDVPTDADSTACVLLSLALRGGFEDACRRGASYLTAHQRRDGGIATYRESGPIRRFMGVGRWMRFGGWCSSHVEVTATAVRALGAAGGHGKVLEAARGYVAARQRPDGGWSPYWWSSPHYAVQQAVEIADRDAVDRAAAWVLAGQAAAETSAFATALSLSVLVRAGADRDPIERAVARLEALQEDDGGWHSQPIMRIPPPWIRNPDRPRRRMRGIVVGDQHRTFTTATCVAALALARGSVDIAPRRN